MGLLLITLWLVNGHSELFILPFFLFSQQMKSIKTQLDSESFNAKLGSHGLEWYVSGLLEILYPNIEYMVMYPSVCLTNLRKPVQMASKNAHIGISTKIGKLERVKIIKFSTHSLENMPKYSSEEKTGLLFLLLIWDC